MECRLLKDMFVVRWSNFTGQIFSYSKVMMRETRSGIRPLGGVRPVEQALIKAIDAAEVRLCF